MVGVEAGRNGIDRKLGIGNSRDVRGLRNVLHPGQSGSDYQVAQYCTWKKLGPCPYLLYTRKYRVAINQADTRNRKTCARKTGKWNNTS